MFFQMVFYGNLTQADNKRLVSGHIQLFSNNSLVNRWKIRSFAVDVESLFATLLKRDSSTGLPL